MSGLIENKYETKLINPFNDIQSGLDTFRVRKISLPYSEIFFKMVLYPESLNALSGPTDLLTEFFVLFRCVLKRFSARTFDQRHRTSLKHTKGVLAFFGLVYSSQSEYVKIEAVKCCWIQLPLEV